MEQKIYLAYDGSINSDWVSRYAINMAGNCDTPQLSLLHIDDGVYAPEKIRAKITAIENDCLNRNIEFTSQLVPESVSVFKTLLDIIPPGAESYCICGARITSRGKGFLAGTISEKLLRARKFNVMAIRVVNPGLLGSPRNLLFPLAGHPQGFRAAMPFLMMLAPSVRRLHILRIMIINSFWFQYLSGPGKRNALAIGKEYLGRVLAEIRKELGEYPIHLDYEVVLSDDWVKDILVKAGKERCGMVLLGASDRLLPSRYFYGNKIEQILRQSPCDVGIYRKV